MKTDWSICKNILCIRLDNMGDLLMSSPAIRALKHSFSASVTVLTSSRGSELANMLPFIDHVMVCNVPWVKLDGEKRADFFRIVNDIKERSFDACVIFTVYSQNPMPAIMLAYLAGIPLRLAYCRENPYELLSDWASDEEPYSIIKHQVTRDLDLVAQIGAHIDSHNYYLPLKQAVHSRVQKKLYQKGIGRNASFLVFHCCVSEEKRQYPEDLWIKTTKLALEVFGFPILFTGTKNEDATISRIQQATGGQSLNCAGMFSLEEFAGVLKEAVVVVSVNTGTIHLASAVGTPTVVLYAQSNPQHTPWGVDHAVLEYSIAEEQKSKNEVIRYVDRLLYSDYKPYPSPVEICESIKKMLSTSLKTAL